MTDLPSIADIKNARLYFLKWKLA